MEINHYSVHFLLCQTPVKLTADKKGEGLLSSAISQPLPATNFENLISFDRNSMDLKVADGQFDYKSDMHFFSQSPVAKSHFYLQGGKKETQSVLNSVNKAFVVDFRPKFVTDVFPGPGNV